MIEAPYLLFLGDAADQLAAKVARGIADWRPDRCLGQIRLPDCQADLGLADLTIKEAQARGARTLIVGVANRGGVISDSWLTVFEQALASGLDIASGLHNLLRDQPRLVEAAKTHGRRLLDVREATEAYPIADGRLRAGNRCLAVGTDCSVGKMYTALALEKEMLAQGRKASFRATGQTGILITGGGVPLDAVVADFMAGAVETITPPNDTDHWDLVEGQGSLFHPSFSGVTMALIHGAAPDALILCHEPTRGHMRGLPHYQLPTLEQLRDTALPLAQVVNPACKVVGISINTAAMDDDAASHYLEQTEQRMGLPTIDPYRHGGTRLADALQ